MRLVLLAAAILSSNLLAAAQDPAPPTLKLTLTADRAKVAVGQWVQFEVRLENTGDKELEIAELTFEERSFSLAVSATFTGAGDRKKDYVLAALRPDPLVAKQMPLPRVALGPKKSVNYFHRVPAIAVGKFEFTAKYAGGGADVSSASVKVDVEATNQGARLAAVVEVEEAAPFKIVLTPEVSPGNVTNLVSLIQRGFYDGTTIHRIVRNSWIHMGCPYGVGVGGPGYAVKAEMDRAIRNEPGSVSMSGYGKADYTGSQFFICLSSLPGLDGKYTPVGRVESDDMTKVIEPISKKDTDRNTDAPRQQVRIKSITLAVVK